MKGWHFAVVFLVLGYIVGFYFPTLGDSTIGQLQPRV